VTPTDYKPDEDFVAHLVAEVPALTAGSGRNCLAGPRQAYDKVPGIPHLVVFVSATGGLPTRALKGNSLGTTDERHPVLRVWVRSSSKGVPTAFQDGQELARRCFDAVHHNPPAGYVESEATGSHPDYDGMDGDGHHWWAIVVQAQVDVVG